MLLVHHIFFLQFYNSLPTCFRNNGLHEVNQQQGSPLDFNSLDFYTRGHQFKSTKSVTSRAGNLEESARQPESCRNCGSSDAQRIDLKLKADTLSTFFKRQRGNKTETILQKTMFIGQFLVLWYIYIYSPSVSLTVNFSTILYNLRS